MTAIVTLKVHRQREGHELPSTFPSHSAPLKTMTSGWSTAIRLPDFGQWQLLQSALQTRSGFGRYFFHVQADLPLFLR